MLIGLSLAESGEAYKRLADEKYTLEDGVKQNFLDPFNQLQNKDLKEVNVSVWLISLDCKLHVFSFSVMRNSFISKWLGSDSELDCFIIQFHRKKLSGRRLDYDCKKRKKDKGGPIRILN